NHASDSSFNKAAARIHSFPAKRATASQVPTITNLTYPSAKSTVSQCDETLNATVLLEMKRLIPTVTLNSLNRVRITTRYRACVPTTWLRTSYVRPRHLSGL